MEVLDCRKIKENELLKLKNYISDKYTLVIIQIGKFIENEIYLKSKRKLLNELNINLIEINYDDTSTKDEIINKIIELNNDKNVNGIIIQKPILNKFDYQELVNYIDYKKDIDGVNIKNYERLQNNLDCIIPCTVRAILKIFDEYEINLINRNIVIIGKSILVGKPLYEILSKNNNVVLCDSKTKNIKDIIKQNEIIISCIGKANYFNFEYFTDNQIIIDVGTNYFCDKLVGDIESNSLRDLNIKITPVPGGVGQLTPIYLVWNLIDKK